MSPEFQLIRLRHTVQDLREKVSREKFLVQTKDMECVKLEDETAFMAREDDIERQRQLGMQRMEDMKVRRRCLDACTRSPPPSHAVARCPHR